MGRKSSMDSTRGDATARAALVIFVPIPENIGIWPISYHYAPGSRANINVGFPLYVACANSRYPHFTATRMEARFSGAMMQAVRGDWKFASPQATAARTASVA